MKQAILLFASILLLLAPACKKCDDLSPSDCKDCYEKLAGDWTLNYLATNGIDSVAFYDSLFASNCIIAFDAYDKHSNDGSVFKISWGNTSDTLVNSFYQGGAYAYIDDGGNLLIYYYGEPQITVNFNPFAMWMPIPQGAGPYWKMKKLSDNELWFELNSNGNIYEIHLSK